MTDQERCRHDFPPAWCALCNGTPRDQIEAVADVGRSTGSGILGRDRKHDPSRNTVHPDPPPAPEIRFVVEGGMEDAYLYYWFAKVILTIDLSENDAQEKWEEEFSRIAFKRLHKVCFDAALYRSPGEIMRHARAFANEGTIPWLTKHPCMVLGCLNMFDLQHGTRGQPRQKCAPCREKNRKINKDVTFVSPDPGSLIPYKGEGGRSPKEKSPAGGSPSGRLSNWGDDHEDRTRLAPRKNPQEKETGGFLRGYGPGGYFVGSGWRRRGPGDTDSSHTGFVQQAKVTDLWVARIVEESAHEALQLIVRGREVERKEDVNKAVKALEVSQLQQGQPADTREGDADAILDALRAIEHRTGADDEEPSAPGDGGSKGAA